MIATIEEVWLIITESGAGWHAEKTLETAEAWRRGFPDIAASRMTIVGPYRLAAPPHKGPGGGEGPRCPTPKRRHRRRT